MLLEHCPEGATQIFIDYYTGHYRPKKDVVVLPVEEEAKPYGALSAVQNLANLLPLPYMNTSSVATPGSSVEQKATVSDAQLTVEKFETPPPEYDTPKPRTAFSSFVDHPQEFIRFLEAVIKQEDLKEEDKIDLYTTLFEMYLETSNHKKIGEKEEWEAKAKKLIEGTNIPIDTSNVLLLSTLSNFRDGTTLVREKQGLHSDIFRSYTSAKDTAGAIKSLKKYGPEEPQLYLDALAYFASSPNILEEAGDELDSVLRKIDEDGLMSPLQVVQTLSSNAVVTMGMVKSYLSGNIERERKEISNNRRLIDSYRSETEQKRKEINELSTKPIVFQNRRCSACGGTLELPAIHFLCKHSFHLGRCVSQGDDAQCPICAPQNSTIKAIRRAQVESADQHSLFQGALQRSIDRFGTVSEFFGRGVMTTHQNG